MSGDDKLSDMDSHGAQPVHLSTEDASDSDSIARGMAARATGDEKAFETRASATSADLSEKSTPSNSSNISKKSVPSSEKAARDKGGYGGVLVISGLVLVIGGIVGALVQFTKKKKNTY